MQNETEWLHFPVFMLAKNCLEVRRNIKYLGHFITDDILMMMTYTVDVSFTGKHHSM